MYERGENAAATYTAISRISTMHLLLSRGKPHFFAAVAMFALITVMAFDPDAGRRALYIVPISIVFIAFLILFGVEYEIVGRAGWSKYAEKHIEAAREGADMRVRAMRAEMEARKFLDGISQPLEDEFRVRRRMSGSPRNLRLDYP